jgi:parvulin-like peptidyl-prolyl isomerase
MSSLSRTRKRILAEPLVHFLLLGLVIFAAYSRVSKLTSDEPGRIVVTQGQVAAMAVSFSRIWQRPPTGDELEGLIRDRVQEEVYYREAIALGLDRDDTIIRRRLRQKMEFISDDVAAEVEPTDEQLQAYLKAHPDAFHAERRFTFTQVYLNPELHGENLARDTAQLLARLKQGGGQAGSAPGDPFMLEPKLEAVPSSEVAKQLGKKFAATLETLTPGQWHGPVESGYGVHLVFLTERTEGRVPALAEVRDAVHREWSAAQRVEANEKFYQSLLQRYVVTIERPHTMQARR